MKRKVNILMVDDQPGKLLSYEAILGELGENLIKAASGNEALEQLLKNDVAVVLIDVNMPGVDGFELADMIRQHPRFEQTAMIFVSAIHMRIWTGSRDTNAEESITSRFQLFPNSCAPRSKCSLSCIGNPSSWER